MPNALPPVHKTRQMFDMEQKNGGRDIRLILVSLYNELGSQAAVAEKLEVTQQTINNWFDQLGIAIETKSVAFIKDVTVVAA